MASYRKRGPRQWQALVRKRSYPLQPKTFRTRAAAEARVHALEYEMDQGLFVSRHEAETTTLGELLERYRSDYTARKRGLESESCRINTLLRRDQAQLQLGCSMPFPLVYWDSMYSGGEFVLLRALYVVTVVASGVSIGAVFFWYTVTQPMTRRREKERSDQADFKYRP